MCFQLTEDGSMELAGRADSGCDVADSAKKGRSKRGEKNQADKRILSNYRVQKKRRGGPPVERSWKKRKTTPEQSHIRNSPKGGTPASSFILSNERRPKGGEVRTKKIPIILGGW